MPSMKKTGLDAGNSQRYYNYTFEMMETDVGNLTQNKSGNRNYFEIFKKPEDSLKFKPKEK